MKVERGYLEVGLAGDWDLFRPSVWTAQVPSYEHCHNYNLWRTAKLYWECHQYASNVSINNVNIFRTQEQRTGYHHQRSWWQEDGLSMCSTSPTSWTSRPLPSTPLSFKVITINDFVLKTSSVVGQSSELFF